MAECGSLAERWLFSQKQLDNSPSRLCGVTAGKELLRRQEAASFIQNLGQRLDVSQLTINTAVVYMHRFYMLQSLTKYHHYDISSAALFLAAKALDQKRKLEDVLKVAHGVLYSNEPKLDLSSLRYLKQEKQLVCLERIILQTLGFEVTVEQPHMHVIKCFQSVEVCNNLARACYLMATNCLHMTTLCLQYKPTVLACLSIHLACKWSRYEIPISEEGKHWWQYVDQSVSLELLDQLSDQFLQVYQKTPRALRRFRQCKPNKAAGKPKSGWQLGKFLLVPPLVENAVTGITEKAGLSNAVPSTFPTAVSKNARRLPIQAALNPGKLETPRARQVYDPPKKNTSSVNPFAMDFKKAIKLFSRIHHTHKGSERSVIIENSHKTTPDKHHGLILPPPLAVRKISLEEYRQRVKQKSTGNKDTGVPLKWQTPKPPAPSNKEALKRKRKSPPSDRHSSSNEGHCKIKYPKMEHGSGNSTNSHKG
ncbi:cyclin-T2-like [Pelobates fuscus]|uniref:cyclin-T2-like n=1 Tax=Pelobates fuscus TaxID=191477 RepID=UPI002FE46DDC